MKNMTLNDIYDVVDDEDKVRLIKKSGVKSFEGVDRLTGREDQIIIYKPEGDEGLKLYVYLNGNDKDVVFVDCSRRLSDLYRWQLPSILKFLRTKGIDLDPQEKFI